MSNLSTENEKPAWHIADVIGRFIMETKKQKIERLIRDEMNTIEILRDKKKDIERQIGSIVDKVSEMRDELNAL